MKSPTYPTLSICPVLPYRCVLVDCWGVVGECFRFSHKYFVNVVVVHDVGKFSELEFDAVDDGKSEFVDVCCVACCE